MPCVHINVSQVDFSDFFLDVADAPLHMTDGSTFLPALTVLNNRRVRLLPLVTKTAARDPTWKYKIGNEMEVVCWNKLSISLLEAMSYTSAALGLHVLAYVQLTFRL